MRVGVALTALFWSASSAFDVKDYRRVCGLDIGVYSIRASVTVRTNAYFVQNVPTVDNKKGIEAVSIDHNGMHGGDYAVRIVGSPGNCGHLGARLVMGGNPIYHELFGNVLNGKMRGPDNEYLYPEVVEASRILVSLADPELVTKSLHCVAVVRSHASAEERARICAAIRLIGVESVNTVDEVIASSVALAMRGTRGKFLVIDIGSDSTSCAAVSVDDVVIDGKPKAMVHIMSQVVDMWSGAMGLDAHLIKKMRAPDVDPSQFFIGMVQAREKLKMNPEVTVILNGSVHRYEYKFTRQELDEVVGWIANRIRQLVMGVSAENKMSRPPIYVIGGGSIMLSTIGPLMGHLNEVGQAILPIDKEHLAATGATILASQQYFNCDWANVIIDSPQTRAEAVSAAGVGSEETQDVQMPQPPFAVVVDGITRDTIAPMNEAESVKQMQEIKDRTAKSHAAFADLNELHQLLLSTKSLMDEEKAAELSAQIAIDGRFPKSLAEEDGSLVLVTDASHREKIVRFVNEVLEHNSLDMSLIKQWKADADELIGRLRQALEDLGMFVETRETLKREVERWTRFLDKSAKDTGAKKLTDDEKSSFDKGLADAKLVLRDSDSEHERVLQDVKTGKYPVAPSLLSKKMAAEKQRLSAVCKRIEISSEARERMMKQMAEEMIRKEQKRLQEEKAKAAAEGTVDTPGASDNDEEEPIDDLAKKVKGDQDDTSGL